MKFGKVLKTWAEMPENSENSDLVLRFKELKKQLKLVKPGADPGTFLRHAVGQATNPVHEYIKLESGAYYHTQDHNHPWVGIDSLSLPAESGEALLDTKVPEPSAIAPLLSDASTSNDAEVTPRIPLHIHS